MTDARRWLWSLAWLALGLAALVNAGCILAAVGAAGAGAAAAGYTYYNGLLYRDYGANLSDTLIAVRTSLGELQFPIINEKTDTGTAYLVTRTANGHTVRIYLDIVPSAIPIEGTLTRVGVRVGYTGDDAISARILDQISRHVLPRPGLVAASASAPSAPPQNPVLLPPRPVAETAPPPLAPIAATPVPTTR